MNIKGLILAAGQGTRLRPLTVETSKPLLPVGNDVMIGHQIQKLVDIGITDIGVVVNVSHKDQFHEIIGDGSTYNASITYLEHVDESRGMPYAISLGSKFVSEEDGFVVLCADVFMEGDLLPALTLFKQDPRKAVVIATRMDDTAGFSRIEQDGNRVVNIHPKDSTVHVPGLIDLGAGIYPYDVFAKATSLYPSRHEVPLTQLHNLYIADHRLQSAVITGYWCDAGSSLDTYYKVKERYEQK